MAPDLALLKKHVRADDISDDDTYLQQLLDTARAQVISDTRRTEDELVGMGGGEDLPVQLQQAVLILAGHWYNQREAVSGVQMQAVPYSYDTLVKPFRKLV